MPIEFKVYGVPVRIVDYGSHKHARIYCKCPFKSAKILGYLISEGFIGPIG